MMVYRVATACQLESLTSSGWEYVSHCVEQEVVQTPLTKAGFRDNQWQESEYRLDVLQRVTYLLRREQESHTAERAAIARADLAEALLKEREAAFASADARVAALEDARAKVAAQLEAERKWTRHYTNERDGANRRSLDVAAKLDKITKALGSERVSQLLAE